MKNWQIKLLQQILGVISAPLKEVVIKFAHDFREQARKTPNPWDDIFADIICWILQID